MFPPSAWAIDILGELTQRMSIAIGAAGQGQILLQNNTEKPEVVRIYQTDYLFYADGRTLYDKPGTNARSNAKWITLTPDQIMVPAKGNATINYTIKVPDDKSLHGSYWSMIMVEPIPEASLTPPKGTEKNPVAYGVTTIIRYGIQIICDVGAPERGMIRFANKRLISDKNQRVFQIDIENTGSKLLAPLVWTELYGNSGTSVGRFEAGRAKVYPGCSARFVIDLSKVPPGTYKAIVVADNGDEDVFGAQYTLDVQ